MLFCFVLARDAVMLFSIGIKTMGPAVSSLVAGALEPWWPFIVARFSLLVLSISVALGLTVVSVGTTAAAITITIATAMVGSYFANFVGELGDFLEHGLELFGEVSDVFVFGGQLCL